MKMDMARRLYHVRQGLYLAIILTAALLLVAIFSRPDYYKVQAVSQEKPALTTRNTARLPASDPVKMAVAISQVVYPATFADNKPNAVILVPRGDWRRALMAANVIHFPVDAPILFIEKDSIPEEVKKEIKRLDPQGFFADRNVKAYIVGDVDHRVKEELLKEKLNFRQFAAGSVYELSEQIDQYRSIIRSDHTDIVMVVPDDRPEYAVFTASWTAHGGDPALFVTRQGIPDATKRILSRRPQDAFIYVLGDEKAVPPHIVAELGLYGHVQRIPGTDPYSVSTGFAGYKDVGPNLGYWIYKTVRSWGWGIAEAGHNFIFVTADNPEMAIPAGILSHRGKHGPMLVVKKDELPEPVIRYLKTVQPTLLASQEQLFNYGWIIGGEDIITPENQAAIEALLQVKMPTNIK